MPDTTVKQLEANELLKERANPDDESTLKLALAIKILSDYKAFKETHPGTQKHPGVRIYKSATDQVIAELFAL